MKVEFPEWADACDLRCGRLSIWCTTITKDGGVDAVGKTDVAEVRVCADPVVVLFLVSSELHGSVS